MAETSKIYILYYFFNFKVENLSGLKFEPYVHDSVSFLAFFKLSNFETYQISKFYIKISNRKAGHVAYKIKALKTARMQTFYCI